MRSQKVNRLCAFLLVLALALSLWPQSVLAAAENAVTLTIFHVNDRHGRTNADPYLAQLAKETAGNVLILDAGDALHGQITANLSKGAAMVELMNEVGYSAMTTGNHEYSYGMDRLQELAKMMDFPLLAANVHTTDSQPLFQSCEVFEMNGVTVGVFGLATPETIASSDPRAMTGLVFDDPVETAKAEVAELKAKGCDIIIALTHMGMDHLSDPAHRSDTLAGVAGIDVIIDGHSHTLLENGLTVGDTLIAQTGEYGQHIGVVEITLSGGTVSKTAKLIPVPAEGEETSLTADTAIIKKIKALDSANDAVTQVVVGHTPVFLQGEKAASRTGETNLADLITDSMCWATGADMAFMTGGNIRASIDAGDITMGEVLTTLPYSNLLTTVELTGADIRKMLEHGVEMYPEAVGQYIHVSGLKFTFDPEAEGGRRVKTVTMSDGSALSPEKVYTVATIDFLSSGGDGYDMMTNGSELIYYGGDAEALVDYLATNPVLNAEPDHRACPVSSDGVLQVIMPDATHGFMAESIRHAEDELAKLAAQTGLRYTLYKSADAALQSDYLDKAVSENASAIVLWPMTGEPLRAAATRAMEAGIPLIVYDRLIPGLTPDSEVLGDNMKIARMAGAYFNEYFADAVAAGQTINILEFAGDNSTVPLQRTQGFMELAGPNVQVAARFDTQWRRDMACEQMKNWLATASVTEIESIQAIYSHEDEVILGVMDAVAAYTGPAKLNIRLIIGLGGKRDVVMHMGYFKNRFNIDLVTYMFSPAMIREAINDGVRAAAGETPAAEHLIGTMEIDRNTLGDYLASETYKTRYTTALPRLDNVPQNAWYSFAVSSRAIEAYASMTANGAFDPNVTMTTGQAHEILAKNLPYGRVTGSINDTTPITRERFAAMLQAALSGYGILEINGAPAYTDSAMIGSAYADAVAYAYKTGLMRGVDGGRFDPQGVITAAQMAFVINNTMNACLTAATQPSIAKEDFVGQRIALWSGTAFEQIFRKNVGEASFVQVNSANEGIEAVRHGTADATMLDEPIARKLLTKYNDLTILPFFITRDDYGFAFGKDNDDLRILFNAFLAEIKANGVHADMVSRWLDTEISPAMPVIPSTGVKGALTFATTYINEPFSYLVNGKPAGFDVELALRFAGYAGYTLEIVPMNFEELIPAVQSGRADFAGNLIIITEERQQLVDFSDPYYTGGTVLVAPHGESKTYASLSSFEGAKVGTLAGAAFAEFIDPVVSNVAYTYFNSLPDLMAALDSGRIEALTIDMPVAKYIAAQHPEYTVFPEVVAKDQYGFAVAKGSPLAEKSNRALKKLMNDGVIADLEAVWFSADESQKTLPALTYKDDFDGSAGTLRFGFANSTEPMSYVDTDGQPAGFDVDLVSRIAYEMNMTVTLVPMGFEKLFAALASGEVDMVGGSMSITAERQKSYDFVGPYYDGGVVFVIKK